jgi:hypothetical protein
MKTLSAGTGVNASIYTETISTKWGKNKIKMQLRKLLMNTYVEILSLPRHFV